MIDPNDLHKFINLFSGRTDAWGTGRGQWIRGTLSAEHYLRHLEGRGPGLGIGPLRNDGTVGFASIDLDEPDFVAAKDMMAFLPGASFLERSRSGNAHVHVFFDRPCKAWVVRGILRNATLAAGKKHVEVFPKQDNLRPGMLGNYINLPLYGDTRPIIGAHSGHALQKDREIPLSEFVSDAASNLNDPTAWEKRAEWLQVASPEARAARGTSAEFGTSPTLHTCCEHIITNRDSNPVGEGHRAVVYFAMAKQLSHCELFNHDEALEMLELVNDASPDPAPMSELERILGNAERGRFVSTGCDDPLFMPYAHPNCKIAHGS